eukprot:COSAG02_NODE_6157_length_3759_cov_4.278142_4_plen_67_part_00
MYGMRIFCMKLVASLHHIYVDPCYAPRLRAVEVDNVNMPDLYPFTLVSNLSYLRYRLWVALSISQQ